VNKDTQSRAARTPLTRIQRGLAERSGLFDRALDLPLVWAVIAIVGCTWLLLPRVGGYLPDWAPGDVATFDVVVPRDVTLPDEAATEAVREEARAAVLPVYDFEPRLEVDLTESIAVLFAACRDGTASEDLAGVSGLRVDGPMLRVLDSAECSERLEKSLRDVVQEVYSLRIVDDQRALVGRGARGVRMRNLASGSERLVELADVSGAIDLRTGLENALRARLLENPAVARRWIAPTLDFLALNMAANLVFNRAETSDRVRRAGEEVAPRSQVFRRGQVLIRRGDTVTFTVARTLHLLNLQRREVTRYSTTLGIGLLVGLLVFGWWRILGKLDSHQATRRRLSMAFLLMLLFVALNRLGVFLATAIAGTSFGPVASSVDAYLWGLPYAAGPVTVFVLMGAQPAILFAVWTALTAGILQGGDFGTVVLALTAGLVGGLALQRLSDRAVFSRAGLAVGVANLAVFAILELFRGLPELPEIVAVSAVASVLGGPVALGVASFLLPILEGLFGVTTDVRLLELSNQNQPLLRKLSLQAPGTYQHSLAVGNLAEAGADAVGANALLLRVCAYYHDVGKLTKPEYFVENQRGTNPHDNLSPSMSVLVIQSHVKQGLEMANRAKLPLPIRQAIATHHGTKLIRFFYNKAKEMSGPEKREVVESDYRYPGPKPHTKELGILLLADAVEAAARTLEIPSPGKIQAMIDRIFTDALEDGQLDDSELTFSELDKVASAFLWVLTNMYHHRIDYPGFDFNRRQRSRDTGPIHVGAKTIAAGS
jgi:putative nucleotidyltransferase with HDIG domain